MSAFRLLRTSRIEAFLLNLPSEKEKVTRTGYLGAKFAMRRFATLDALRGIAAIGVMLSHARGYTVRVPSGYLAVDLFFVLSGFVVSLAYQERLRDGLSVGRFMALRAARLWPMLLVGAALGIALLHGNLGMVLLIPDLSSASQLFPANGPLWSLMMETGAYLVFASVLVRLQLRGLIAVTVVSGLALLVFATFGSATLIQFGNEWHALPHGIARTAYAFSLGAVMYRLRLKEGLRRIVSARAWMLPAALCYLMLLVPQANWWASLLSMMLVVPLIVWWATKWEVPNPRLADDLSSLSYPLYCIHFPLMAFAGWYGLPVLPLLLPLVIISLGLDRWWDRPVRRVLRRWAEDVGQLDCGATHKRAIAPKT